ncbi:MAG TPA: asparagine--tRNA ligase [Bacilli bacterium]|nr:asparagine--tRNA ligase [Bacilli bacterium]
MKKDLKEIFESDYTGKEIVVEGWVKNHRKQKEFGFIDFSDGTCFKRLQIVYTDDLSDFNEIAKIHIGSAVRITGELVKSEGKGQDVELKASKVELLGDCPEDYPIQPKPHSREFLREVAYLRPRANLFQAVFRVRSVAAMAIHEYFQSNGYVYLHSPILTANDCEGAGEMFQVTTLDLKKVAESGEVDYTKDFFGKPAALTVSGQLHGEAYALAFKKIYTFGPTFRAENSNTKTHANEFWMMEPEIAFCDINGLMDVEEEMLKFVIKYVLDHCKEEIVFFDQFVEKGLLDKLNAVLTSTAARITHKEAIDILIASKEKFEFTPKHGEDLAREHEKYLTEKHFHSPVFVKDWPKDIKSFYMRQNDDGETLAGVDLLVPGAGELTGGSQREERLDKLLAIMKERNMNLDEIEWFVNLRKFGGVYHSGFGIGFERLIMYLTGVDNIRDVIPFPRTPKSIEY